MMVSNTRVSKGVVAVELVAAGREQRRGRFRVGENGGDAGHRQRRFAVDRHHAGVGMRRAQQLGVEQACGGEIGGEAHRARHDAGAGRGAEIAGPVGVAPARDGVRHRAVAGAAAQVALQRRGQVGAPAPVERRRRHDHAGGAEAALEPLRVQEGALHRVQFALGRPRRPRQPLDGGDVAAARPERRGDAAVDRLAVDPHRAGPAVAGVAALLDAEPAEVAQKGAQALAGAGRVLRRDAVDGEAHGAPSSSRISPARCAVTARRHAGRPWTSSKTSASGIAARSARSVPGAGRAG